MARSSVVSILIKVGTAGLGAISSVGRGLRGLKDQILSLRTAVAAVAAFVVGKIGKDLVGAFAEQEGAIVRLNAALRVTGRFTEEGSRRIQAMAAEMQRLTTVSDEASLAAAATVASFARELTPDQLAQVQQAAIGLAQVLGTDVQSAAIQLGKTLSGEMNALGRLGISIDTTATQQDRFNEIMRKTGPFFQIAVESTRSLQGQFAQARNQIGELRETLGQVIVESLNLGTGQTSLAERIARVNETLQENIGTWVKWGRVGVAVLKAVAVSTFNLVKLAFNVGQAIGNTLKFLFFGIGGLLEQATNLAFRTLNKLIIQINKVLPDFLDIPLIEEGAELFRELAAGALADLKTDADDGAQAIRNIGVAFGEVAAALRAEPLPRKAFDITGRGAGPDVGPRTTGDPVAESKRLAVQAQVLQRQFEQNAISVDAFRATLATLGPAMARLLAPGSGLTGPDLEQFRVVVDALRAAAAAVGLTFDATGVHAMGFAETFARSARAAEKAAGSLNQVLADQLMATFLALGQAISEAFTAMVDGSQSAGQAFATAMLGALSQVAAGFGQFFLAKAAGALGEGLLGNPAAFAAAAKYTAAAVAMFALAGALQGFANRNAGGGGGGGGAAGAADATDAVTRQEPPLELTVIGDVNHLAPDFVDKMAETLMEATGRNVILTKID